ncbi:MAG: glycosyltransferase family 9 protein [Rhodospirillales bacterium]|nr:glycosyltransferase family 9 protein [Rhodospirillales bacterium]
MRILFITATRIGDAVLSTGILDHLIGRYPGARITVACGPAAAPLFEAVPNLERIIVLRKKKWSLHWLGLWTSCVGQFWDVMIDLRRAPLSYLLAGRDTRHLPRNSADAHRVVDLAGLLGLANDPPAPRLWASEAHEGRVGELIGEGPPVLAIGPTANWEAKTWRPGSFAELIARLTAPDGILPGARVAFFGHADERAGVAELIDTVPVDRCIDLMGGPHLLEVFACLKRCALYVGNDSGLMHISAAAAIPTLGLFGPSREELYAPWGARCAVVRGPKEFFDIFPENFDHRDTASLMDGLSVDAVEEAANGLWRASKEAQA